MLLCDAVTKVMDMMDLSPTPLRMAFLHKFEALLCLRGFSRVDPRSIQSAIEVIVNFSRSPVKQNHYYRAVIRNLDKLIEKAMKKEAYRLENNNEMEWDCPGHVDQVRSPVAPPRTRHIFLTGRLAPVN